MFKKILLPIVLALTSSYAAAEPPDPGKWEVVPGLTDDFRGTSLDTTKWLFKDPTYRGNKPGLFVPSNVLVKNGTLILQAKREELINPPEGFNSYSTAHIRSVEKVRYGYFEARCKPAKARLDSAFWMYDHQPEQWTEIDVFEISGTTPKHKRSVHTNAHLFHSPEYRGTIQKHRQFPETWEVSVDLASEFRTYAVEWDENMIKWYLDGKLIREMKNLYWHQPLSVCFTVALSPNWFGMPEDSELPVDFVIDYVRVWKRK